MIDGLGFWHRCDIGLFGMYRFGSEWMDLLNFDVLPPSENRVDFSRDVSREIQFYLFEKRIEIRRERKVK